MFACCDKKCWQKKKRKRRFEKKLLEKKKVVSVTNNLKEFDWRSFANFFFYRVGNQVAMASLRLTTCHSIGIVDDRKTWLKHG